MTRNDLKDFFTCSEDAHEERSKTHSKSDRGEQAGRLTSAVFLVERPFFPTIIVHDTSSRRRREVRPR